MKEKVEQVQVQATFQFGRLCSSKKLHSPPWSSIVEKCWSLKRSCEAWSFTLGNFLKEEPWWLRVSYRLHGHEAKVIDEHTARMERYTNDKHGSLCCESIQCNSNRRLVWHRHNRLWCILRCRYRPGFPGESRDASEVYSLWGRNQLNTLGAPWMSTYRPSPWQRHGHRGLPSPGPRTPDGILNGECARHGGWHVSRCNGSQRPCIQWRQRR